jgi:16S rRNA (guanine1207-N2)-methyltransferase
MSLSNTSQLLLRNIDLLDAKQALLINSPADLLTREYSQHYPLCNIDCFNVNYTEHLAITKLNNAQVNCHFSACYQNDLKHDLVILFFPKSKAEFSFTLTMINHALAPNAKILIVGENNGGVKSAIKLGQPFLNFCEKVDSARHCSLFLGEFNNKDISFCIDDWFKNYQLSLNDITLTIASLPGVFSQNELDLGTKLLLNHLPPKMSGKVLDFGCGAGVISAYIGKKYSLTQLSLLDINALALKSAEKTLKINNLSGHIFASDSLGNITEKYQHVVSNPPFHQGLKTYYASTETFLSGIKNYIFKSGDITIVANNFLRYQPIMMEKIGKTSTIANKNGFCVYYCQR